MAAAILQQRLAERGVDARVTSAGTRPWSAGATDPAVAVMGEYGLDISDHQNRHVTRELLEEADLVLGMTRDHLSIAVARDPGARGRTFLVGELARLGAGIGPRAESEPVARWAERAADARPLQRPLGRAVDEIADPVGEPIDVYRRTAAELDQRLTEIAALLAGVPTLARRRPLGRPPEQSRSLRRR
jgi:low molecular weight protein-tyrosine phosphatase